MCSSTLVIWGWLHGDVGRGLVESGTCELVVEGSFTASYIPSSGDGFVYFFPLRTYVAKSGEGFLHCLYAGFLLFLF